MKPFVTWTPVDLKIVDSWVLPILSKGKKKELDLDDLYQPLDEHLAQNLGSKLEKAWEEELKMKRGKNKQPSLMAAGLKVFGKDVVLSGCCMLAIEMLFKVTMPFFLGGIIKYYANPEESNISEAYWYSAGIIACNLFSVLAVHPLCLKYFADGMRIRISACSLVYRKSLKLSKTALIDTTAGQVVNLLSNDVGR